MPFNDGRVVPAFIGQALSNTNISLFGDGSQTRSFCFVSDLVDGLYRLIHSREHLPINLGNPNEECTIVSLAQTIIRLTNSKSNVEHFPLPPDDPKVRCPNIAKAVELLGWRPTTSMEDGLKRTLHYHLQK
jgi:dTDP-glucose 4,6-dehydratase